MKNPVTTYGYSDFPTGAKVRVVSHVVDFNFFYGETGTVKNNTMQYLGIRVAFDKPREFTDGYVQKEFGFEPKNLEPIEDEPLWFETGVFE